MSAAPTPRTIAHRHSKESADDVIERKGLSGEPTFEQHIIGGILASPEPNKTFSRVSELLNETDFSSEKYRTVFASMQNVVSHGDTLSVLLIGKDLERRGELTRFPSVAADLTVGSPQISNIESLCRAVAECAERRRLYVGLEAVQERILSDDPLEEVEADASRVMAATCSRRHSLKPDEIGPVAGYAPKNIEFVVDGLIACGSVTGFTGDSGAGKSTLLTAMAGHVALGEPFMGRSCSRRNVLIVDRENPGAVVNERLGRLHLQDGEAMRIWGGWCDSPPPALDSPEILKWVVQTHPKPLIIVDSFIAFLDGDENDSFIVRRFMHQLRRLADAGAAVGLIHHIGKGESSRQYRGSSDFKAGLDLGFTVTNMGDAKRLERLRLEAFKMCFTAEGDLIVRYKDGEFSADERPFAVDKTVTARLTELLRGNPGIRTAEFEALAVSAGLGRNRARKFLQDSSELGWLRQEPGPHNTLFNYLTEQQEE